MPIMAIALYCDTLSFFRNQFSNIMLLVFLVALVSALLGQALSPGNEQLIILSAANQIGKTREISFQQWVQALPIEQQHILFKASVAGTIANLASSTLLVGGLLSIIRIASNRQPISVLRAIFLSVPFLPRLLLLTLLTMLLVQMGLFLVIVPGVLLAVAFSLAPIILNRKNTSIVRSMHMSAILVFSHFRLLALPILFWLLSKVIIIFFLATQFASTPSLLETTLLNTGGNLISAFLLIYLYRFYMLLHLA